MRTSNILLLLSLTLCSFSNAQEPHTNRVGISDTNEVDIGVVITSVQAGRPIVVSIERKKYPKLGKAPKGSAVDRGDASYFFSSPGWGDVHLSKGVVDQWRTNYILFSQALISAAQRARLDTSSLTKILEIMRPRADDEKGRILPVAAHSTTREGEPVWVVAFRWEQEKIAAKDGTMDDIGQFTYTQKTLKLVDSTVGN